MWRHRPKANSSIGDGKCCRVEAVVDYCDGTRPAKAVERLRDSMKVCANGDVMPEKLSPNLPFGNRITLTVIALVFLSILVILPLAGVWGAHTPLRLSVNQEGRDCGQSGSPIYYTQFMVSNDAPWTQIVPIPSRDLVSNNFVVNQIAFTDSQPDQSGTPLTVSLALSPSPTVATWTITASPYFAPRWNPIVLPGETTAVLYVGWVCDSTTNLGVHRVQVTISGTYQGSPVDLTTEFSYKAVP
jgi:hypothetical protein